MIGSQDGIIRDMIDYTIRYFGLTIESFSAKCRKEELVRARYFFYGLAKMSSSVRMSLSELGLIAGGFNHATVLWGLKQLSIPYNKEDFFNFCHSYNLYAGKGNRMTDPITKIAKPKQKWKPVSNHKKIFSYMQSYLDNNTPIISEWQPNKNDKLRIRYLLDINNISDDIKYYQLPYNSKDMLYIKEGNEFDIKQNIYILHLRSIGYEYCEDVSKFDKYFNANRTMAISISENEFNNIFEKTYNNHKYLKIS